MQAFTDLYDRVPAARSQIHTLTYARMHVGAQADCGSGNYFFTMISARWKTQTPCIWSHWSQLLPFLQEEHPETRAAVLSWPVYLCFNDKSLHRSLSRISSTIFKTGWVKVPPGGSHLTVVNRSTMAVLPCSNGSYPSVVNMPRSSCAQKACTSPWYLSPASPLKSDEPPFSLCFPHWALIKQITCPLVTRLFDLMLLSSEKELIIRLQNSPHPTFSPLMRNNPINFWTRVIAVNVIFLPLSNATCLW